MQCRITGLMLGLWLLAVVPVQGATGRVIKVLPQFLDLKGRDSVSPSLYDRDAYQANLRMHPEKRSGLRFHVQWKTKGATWAPLKLKIELRGIAEGNLPRQYRLEEVLTPHGRFSHWTDLAITGEAYRQFGEVTAWRVTLWEGDQLLGEQTSFLW